MCGHSVLLSARWEQARNLQRNQHPTAAYAWLLKHKKEARPSTCERQARTHLLASDGALPGSRLRKAPRRSSILSQSRRDSRPAATAAMRYARLPPQRRRNRPSTRRAAAPHCPKRVPSARHGPAASQTPPAHRLPQAARTRPLQHEMRLPPSSQHAPSQQPIVRPQPNPTPSSPPMTFPPPLPASPPPPSPPP
eukprot:5431078-Pleurochrysis_carterae.AAC.1